MFFYHFLNILFGKKRLRQSIDELLNISFHVYFWKVVVVHGLLNIVWGRRRQQQNIYHSLVCVCSCFSDVSIMF